MSIYEAIETAMQLVRTPTNTSVSCREGALDLQPRDEAVKFVPPFDSERQRCALGMR